MPIMIPFVGAMERPIVMGVKQRHMVLKPIQRANAKSSKQG